MIFYKQELEVLCDGIKKLNELNNKYSYIHIIGKLEKAIKDDYPINFETERMQNTQDLINKFGRIYSNSCFNVRIFEDGSLKFNGHDHDTQVAFRKFMRDNHKEKK